MNLHDLYARLVESLRSMDSITLLTLFTFLITEVLILVIATFLLVKALLLRRTTALGVALAKNNVAMALVYYSAFIGLWIPIVRHPYISVTLRILVMCTAAGAIRAFVDVYGGWRATGREIVRSVIEIARDLVDHFTGRNANRRVLARTRRRHAARLNETYLLATYSGLKVKQFANGERAYYRT